MDKESSKKSPESKDRELSERTEDEHYVNNEQQRNYEEIDESEKLEKSEEFRESKKASQRGSYVQEIESRLEDEKSQTAATKENQSLASEGVSEALSRGNSEENLSVESDAGYSSPERRESPHLEDEGGKSFSTWENALEYLGKNHALLRPFQEVKRIQLLKERDAFILQIRQTEQQTNDVIKRNTKLGAQLYSLQEDVTRAQVKLDEAKLERVCVKSSKKSAEDNLKKAEKADEEQRQEVTKASEKERKLFAELWEVDKRIALGKLIRSKCDSDLTSLRQSLQSVLWDRKKIEKAKDIQEFHLDRLRASLQREENTLIILRDAAERAAVEARELKEAAREQMEELGAVERESKAVEKAWEENVSLMEKKSDMFSDALKSLISLRAEEAGLRNEVSNARKEVKEIQLEHEKTTHRFLRLQYHLISQREQLNTAEENLIEETEKKQNLEETIAKLNDTLQEATKAYENECALLTMVYKRLAAATERHRKLEDASFEKLSEHTTASKATENVKAKIKLLKQNGRFLEDEMVAEEQLTAREALKASNLKKKLQSIKEERKTIQEHVNEMQELATEQEISYRQKQERIKSNTNILDRLKKEVIKLIDLCQGDESPPLEREERALQLELKEAERLRLRLEQEALMMQKKNVEDIKRKQNLERNELDLKKELQLLKDRSLRLKDEVHDEQKSFHRVELSRKSLDTARRDVDNQLHQINCSLQEATHLSGVSETEQISAIKELERECVEENRHLETLRINLDHLEERLTEATKERSLWEKRLLSAKKAKEEFLKEKGAQGEMEVMKREINRMNVRWHALEATQNELSQRLVKSVKSEDALKTRAAAALENAQRNPSIAKATREMQIDSLKRKFNSTRKILNNLRQKTDSLQQQKKQVQEELQMKQRLYMVSSKMLQDTENALQEKSATKHEKQILLQEERLRLRLLNSLKENRYRSLAANNEEAQKSVGISLVKRAEAYRNVVGQLLAAYPLLARSFSAANRLLDLKSD